MIYLQDNPLLKEPLKPEHIKNRLLGHWGSSPGLAFTYIHLNRLIKKLDLDMIFMAGPGHGAPGVLGARLSGGHLLRGLSGKERGRARTARILQTVLVSRRDREPLHAGNARLDTRRRRARLRAVACLWRRFRQSGLIVAAVVGDGESETGPLATSWHISKFLNPVRDGAVLPILHLNGYKINNPTLLARITHEELEDLLRGYGWTPTSSKDPIPKACTRPWRPRWSTVLRRSEKRNANAARPAWRAGRAGP
jgi:xylulose-5-phosphate/fructose-6-phosphate phosphoketolase